MKLKTLLEEIAWDRQQKGKPEQDVRPPITEEQRKQVMEMIKSYNTYGDALHKQHDLLEIAKNLHTIASFAENFTLSESERTAQGGKSWFDEVTIKRNMTDLKRRCDEFAKCAEDAQKSNYRLEALWEDMGHILSRYYEIAECADVMPIGGNPVTQQPVLQELAAGDPAFKQIGSTDDKKEDESDVEGDPDLEHDMDVATGRQPAGSQHSDVNNK